MRYLHPFSDGEFPDQRLRRHYTGRFRGDFGRAVDQVFLPFDELLERALEGRLSVDAAWPSQHTPHFLPRHWDRMADKASFQPDSDFSKESLLAFCKTEILSESPVLCTLMFRINVTHRIFSAHEDNPKWLQQLRMFMDTHCAMVTFVASLEAKLGRAIKDQDLVDAGCFFTESNALWADIMPCNRHIVSERLISYPIASVFTLNLCFKQDSTKKEASRLSQILQKCLPHSGALRLLYSMIAERCEDEEFYRVLMYIIFCTFMGTYEVAAAAPYEMRVQALIWSSFAGQTREALCGFFQAKHAEHIVIYACRQFLDYLATLVPAFHSILVKTYAWEYHCNQTRTIMRSARAYFIDVAPLIERARAISDEEADRVKVDMWSQIVWLLTIFHKDHSHDAKVKKQCVANIVKHLDNLKPSLLGLPITDFDPRLIGRRVWKHACRVASLHPVNEGITRRAIDELGMSARGTYIVKSVLESLEKGSIAGTGLFLSIPPGDIEVFIAYIKAIKHQFKVCVDFWDTQTAVIQKLAIHRRLGIDPEEPLDDLATAFDFCQTCCQFRYTMMSDSKAKRSDSLSNGPKYSAFAMFTKLRMCSYRHRKCSGLLTQIQMIGKIIKVQSSKIFTLCCGCGLPYKYNPNVKYNGFPWCGKCDASHIDQYTDEYFEDLERQQAEKDALWEKYFVKKRKRPRVSCDASLKDPCRASHHHEP